jgi:hypothetical protein
MLLRIILLAEYSERKRRRAGPPGSCFAPGRAPARWARVGDEGTVEAGVIHHVASDLVGRIGDAVRVPLVRSQQSGGASPVRCRRSRTAARRLVADTIASYQCTAVTVFFSSVSIGTPAGRGALALGRCTWWMPLYMAPIGQMGWQLLLPQQAGRPSTGWWCGPAEWAPIVVAVRVDHLGEGAVAIAPRDHVHIGAWLRSARRLLPPGR